MTCIAGPIVRNGAGTWQISRHAEVLQALRDPRLVPPGQAGSAAAAVTADLHAAVAQALTAERLQAWRARSAAHALELLDLLPQGAAVDLVQTLAVPWSQDLAAQVCGMPAEQARAFEPQARALYMAAAQADSGRTGSAAADAAVQLAQALAALPNREHGAADVQTFVALQQTLPALLAGAWLALLRDGTALAHLLAAPHETAAYAGELLRLGSPAQRVFREADAELEIAGARLSRGDAVELLLAAANRDPQQFPEPHRLNPARAGGALPLGLGAGPHHCAGAALVRMALLVATQALLERCGDIALIDPHPASVRWRGGTAMCAPAALQVRWRPRA